MERRLPANFRAWCARWLSRVGTSPRKERCFVSPGRAAFRLPAEWTGSSCRAQLSTETPARRCRSCSRRSNAARPWSRWTTAPTVCCRRSGCAASARWPRWARRTAITFAFGPTRLAFSTRCLPPSPAVDCDEAFRRVRQELARFQTIEPCGTTGRASRAPARLPARRPGLDAFSAAILFWRVPRRRYGRGQDSAGACPAGDPPRAARPGRDRCSLAGRRSQIAHLQLEAGGGAIHSADSRARLHRHCPEPETISPATTSSSRLTERCARDALHFKDQVFDYVILDEAQAVKNAKTESAKAVRLLRGNHRLAMSGTPVENHLGELWSLLEFLNPGMLGAFGVFQLTGGAMRNPSEDARKLLAHALRPFLLRRTKEQVATELPPKIEQTIYCEMEPRQRTLYDELREHYRDVAVAQDQYGRHREVEDTGAGGPAAAASGGLPSRA